MGTLSFSFYSITPAKPLASPSLSQSHNNKPFSTAQQSCSIHLDDSRSRRGRRVSVQFRGKISLVARSAPIAAAMKEEPLRIIISGAPASGKGTQCELIKKKQERRPCRHPHHLQERRRQDRVSQKLEIRIFGLMLTAARCMSTCISTAAESMLTSLKVVPSKSDWIQIPHFDVEG